MNKRDIKYINKDFSSLKTDLVSFIKTYFPNTYTDFNESSPGMMFVELASYIGDIMSFYTDNQIQENFIQYARQADNLYSLAYMFGYKPKITSLANVNLDFYQILPSKNIGGQYLPDYDYALYVDSNTQISSNSNPNIKFLIEDPIDFTVSSSYDPTVVSIHTVNGDVPEYFLLKKTRKAVSGGINSSQFSFGEPTEFPTITLSQNNIAEILDITDSNGNKWYEVDYLAQELIYEGNKNLNNNQDTPYILQTKQIQRRFTTRVLNNNTIQIQFGSGKPSDDDLEKLPDPSNVGIGLPFERTKLTTAYSPLNFLFTNTYGISPSNTILTVRYLTGGGIESNVPSNDLNNLDKTNIRFLKSNLNSSIAQFVFDSIVSTNEFPASGGKDGDTEEEIRQNSIANFSSQMRSVTMDDYLIRALSMPSKYGTISKAYIKKSNAQNKDSNLELYILTYDYLKKLIPASITLKNNLKTYLNQFRAIGDSIIIKDAFVINIGVDFDIILLPNYNGNEILLKCIKEIQNYFDINRWQVNQPIILSEIYLLLNKIDGVQTVKNIKIINKTGENSGYSKFAYDIEGANKNNVIYPSLDPSVFELKYPENDIHGRISNF